MRWNQRKLRFALPFIVLFVSVVGGWALSGSSDDVDANLTEPGVVQTPGIGTNANNAGKPFSFVEVTDNLTGERGTIAPAGKPMVINFWFSTCEPCKREMPALTAASQKYAGKVDFIGINPNDTSEVADAFIAKYNITFPTFLDDGTQLSAAGVATMPSTFFLDSTGNIIERRAGEITAADIDSILQSKLGVNA
jgi:thiol-disulfide isomerase/thioredoxin